MNFLPDESEVYSLKGNNVVGQLTNQRLIYVNTADNKTQVKIIPVESIDAYEIIATQNSVWLWLALFAFIWGIASDNFAIGILGVIIFVILFFATKKTGCFVYSTSGKVEINIAVTNIETAHQFFFEIGQVQATTRANKGKRFTPAVS